MEKLIYYKLNRTDKRISFRTDSFGISEALSFYNDFKINEITSFYAINEDTYIQYFEKDYKSISNVFDLINVVNDLHHNGFSIINFLVDIENEISILSHDEDFVEFFHYGETEFDIIKKKYKINDALFDNLQNHIGKGLFVNLKGELMEICDD
jgi:hypothetical protein